MTEYISSLIAALGVQLKVYAGLYELSVQKRDALERQDIDKLNKVVRDEQPLLIQLDESERERLRIVAEFKNALDMPEDKITINDIIEICPPSYTAALTRIHTELSNALRLQISINEINRKLIESRLEYISFMMDTASGGVSNSYNTTGADVRPKPSGSRMIDLGI